MRPAARSSTSPHLRAGHQPATTRTSLGLRARARGPVSPPAWRRLLTPWPFGQLHLPGGWWTPGLARSRSRMTPPTRGPPPVLVTRRHRAAAMESSRRPAGPADRLCRQAAIHPAAPVTDRRSFRRSASITRPRRSAAPRRRRPDELGTGGQPSCTARHGQGQRGQSGPLAAWSAR